MAELDSLIRVRRHTVEQKQRFLSELYRQAEALEQQRLSLELQLAAEQEGVRAMDVAMLNFFGSYSKAVKSRVEDIIKAREKLEMRIKFAQEDMRLAFAEMKKIEIIQRRRQEEEEAARNRKDAQVLDDIGIEGFRRQEEEG